MTTDPDSLIEPIDGPPPEPKGAPTHAPRRSFFREVRWRWSDVLIGLAPLAAVRVAGALIDPVLLSAAPRWLWLPIAGISYCWVLLYTLWIVRRRHGGWPQLPRPRAIFVESRLALAAAALVMVAQIAFFSFLTYFYGDRAMPATPLEPILRSPNWFESVGLVVLILLVIPVAEEVFFRGMLYNALRQRLRVAVAAPLQAVVFAALHLYGLTGMAVVALIGVALALVYEWRKTLLTPVVMHVLINVLAMAGTALSIAADAAAPRLGVRGEAHQGGCLVMEVVPGSAADTTGLRVGDVITSLDGDPVADMRRLTEAVRSKWVGQQVVVEFLREGKAERVDVVLQRLQE